MKFTILKYCHFSNFIPSIKLIKDNTLSIIKNIIFDNSCIYSIDEKSCVNKLFGFQFGIFGVHKNSFRYGWTYNKETNKIDLYAYIYANKKLYKNKISSVNIGEEINLAMLYEYNSLLQYYTIDYIVNGATMLSQFYNCNKHNLLAFTLGFYFGGKTRAPHKMSIIEK